MAFDRFETRVDAADFIAWPNGGGMQPVRLIVNGIELVDLVRAAEMPFADLELDRRIAAGELEPPARSLAGRYRYLSSRMTFLPSRTLLGEPYEHCFADDAESAGKSVLLGCECGVIDCWFLLARIEVTDTDVRWSGFRQFHRKSWQLALGPFCFERAPYEAALVAR